MFRKLIVIIITIGLVGSSIAYAPKINAYSVVSDPVTNINTGISAGSNVAITVKEYILDTIARVIARSLLNVAISGIINKIQTGGRNGGPAFVQNWRNFQTDAQYRGEDVFRSILSSTRLCDYLSNDIKGLFRANGSIRPLGQNIRVGNFDPFTLRANCTMPSNFNLASYQNDFSGNGGWNAWSRMLEPQNNYYGLLFSSLDEAAMQRDVEQSGDVYEATAGSGYTSIRANCQDQLAGAGDVGPSQPSQARCTFMGKVFTPADLLGKSAASTIDQDLGWLVSSDELSEVIIAIGAAITNRLINLATSNPSNDYTTAPEADTSNSRGYLECVNSCPSSDNLTCQTNCAATWGYNSPQASSTPPPPGGGGGGGGGGTGVCRDPGYTTANYSGDLQAAIDAVIAANPNGIADMMNTTDASFMFLDYVVQELRSAGLNASTGVLNGNDNPTSGDLIAVWRSGDPAIERYDAVQSVGSGNLSMREAAGSPRQPIYSGDIPFVCLGSGTPEPTPEPTPGG